MRRHNTHFKQLQAALFLCAAFLAGCGAPSKPAQPIAVDKPTSPYQNIAESATGFTGDAVCASCHEAEWTGFQSHGMAKSWYPLSAENAIEDFSASPIKHPTTGLYYRAFRVDSGFFIEEYLNDHDGKRVHSLTRSMDFVVGSGTAARTYVTVENGRVFELPITWYTQEGKWDLSPGYAVSNGRFDRLIPDRCMACHNSYPESVPFADGKYDLVPNGIGCERCHGPGELHVEERLISEQAEGDIDYTIVNPADLPVDRQLDVCQQCHLQTTVSLLREGRQPFDFRPTESLADHVALFAEGKAIAEAEEIDVISHADRMKRSECFLQTIESSNPLSCTSCHNPHEGFRQSGPEYFSASCINCHAVDGLRAILSDSPALTDHSVTANCASCHMPKVDADAVPHSSFTDHWIRVVGESAGDVSPIRTGEASLTAYFPVDGEGAPGRIYRGMASIVYGKQRQDSSAYRSGIRVLGAELGSVEGFGEAHYLLGFARVALGETSQAIAPLEESVRIDPDIPERLNTLALAYEATGRDPAKIENLYRQALLIQPAGSDIRVNYGRFLEKLERINEARAQYEAAVAEMPSLAVGHYNLGTLLLRSGNLKAAEESLRQAVHLDPLYDAAVGNLGLLYASSGRAEQARERFERALDVAPESPVALSNMARYKFNNGDYPGAVDLLKQLVRIQPESSEAFTDLAHASFLLDDLVGARNAAERAIALQPDNARARQILEAL